ncbi:hypothetical protein [Lactobacillus taiwanensis]|uniref:hypothetical protein n=1 Tax=Lactobacillus taiwanensis TaxID=508451 RepID=UPI0025B11065|nr:hypothetical protein [Lactobacillus taiwanensis]
MEIYEVRLINTNKKFYVVAESAEQAISSAYVRVVLDYSEFCPCEMEAQLIWKPSD